MQIPSSFPAPCRRRWLRHVAALSVLALPVAARAGYNVWTGDYTLDRRELQAGLDKRFPVSMRYAEVFQVQLFQPRLGFDPQANRLGITADARVSSPLLLPAPLPGLLTLTSGLKYDPEARAVRLHEPAADRLELRGISDRDGRQLQAVGSAVAQEVLRDYPIHTFKPEDLRFGNRDVILGEIVVTADGIKVEVR